MGLFSAVIDRSPIDRFGGNAAAQSLLQQTQVATTRADQLWDPNSIRNQLQQQQLMQNMHDLQAGQSLQASRLAAKTGGAGLAGLGKSLGVVASGIGSLVTGILVVVAVVLTVIAVFKLWEDRAQVLAYWNNVIADSLDRIGRGADRAKEAIRDFFSIDLLGDIGNLVSGGDPASEAQGGV